MVSNAIKDVIDIVYPVGSVYISFNNTSPETLFGGEWEQIVNYFLYPSSSSGTTGGEAQHTLTEDEMPSHTHSGLYLPRNSINVQGGGSDGNFHALETSNRSASVYAAGGG